MMSSPSWASKDWKNLKQNCDESSQKIIVNCEVKKWVWDLYGNDVHKQVLPVKTVVSAEVQFSQNIKKNNKQANIARQEDNEDNTLSCSYIAQEEVTYAGPIKISCSDLDKVSENFSDFCHKQLKLGTSQHNKYEISRKIVPGSVRSACVALGQSQGQTYSSVNDDKVFNTDVLESIKETGKAIQNFEQSIIEPLQQLEKYKTQLQNSQCQNGDSKPKCRQLQKEVSGYYLSFLETMDYNLTPVYAKVYQTTQKLSERLNVTMAGNRTLKDLQESILGNGKVPRSSKEINNSLSRRNFAGQSLSQRFKKYLDIISLQGSQNKPLSLVAVDIYAGLKESLSYIDLIKNNIHNSKILLELSSFNEDLSENSINKTISSLQSLLFGKGNVETEEMPELEKSETNGSSNWEKELGIR